MSADRKDWATLKCEVVFKGGVGADGTPEFIPWEWGGVLRDRTKVTYLINNGGKLVWHDDGSIHGENIPATPIYVDDLFMVEHHFHESTVCESSGEPRAVHGVYFRNGGWLRCVYAPGCFLKALEMKGASLRLHRKCAAVFFPDAELEAYRHA